MFLRRGNTRCRIDGLNRRVPQDADTLAHRMLLSVVSNALLTPWTGCLHHSLRRLGCIVRQATVRRRERFDTYYTAHEQYDHGHAHQPENASSVVASAAIRPGGNRPAPTPEPSAKPLLYLSDLTSSGIELPNLTGLRSQENCRWLKQPPAARRGQQLGILRPRLHRLRSEERSGRQIDCRRAKCACAK
jgi:hypothetical protein